MPDYDKIKTFRNTCAGFPRFMQVETTELGEGCATAIMPVWEELCNPQGAVHGGVLHTLADEAVSSAAISHGQWVATISSDFHYLRAGLNTTALTAQAREVKYGKRACVYSVEVTDQDGTVLACGTFTVAMLGKAIEL